MGAHAHCRSLAVRLLVRPRASAVFGGDSAAPRRALHHAARPQQSNLQLAGKKNHRTSGTSATGAATATTTTTTTTLDRRKAWVFSSPTSHLRPPTERQRRFFATKDKTKTKKKKKKQRHRRPSATEREIEGGREPKPLQFLALFFNDGVGLTVANMVADTDYDMRDVRAMGLPLPPNVDPRTGELLYGPYDDRAEKKVEYEDIERAKDRGRARMRNAFGPLGHDYSLAPDAGPPLSAAEGGFDDEDKMHECLSARLFARLSNDFDSADRLRDALNERGVYVDDRRREWRADGRMPSGKPMRSRWGQEKETGEFTDDLREVAHDEEEEDEDAGIFFDDLDDIHETDDDDDEEEEEMERLAREVRARMVNQFGPLGHDYKPAKGAKPPLPPSEDEGGFGLDEEEMHEMLSARLLAKLEGDYETADYIREALEEFGVQINDDKREWRAHGKIRRKGESAAVHLDEEEMHFDDEEIHFDDEEMRFDDEEIREDDEENKEKD